MTQDQAADKIPSSTDEKHVLRVVNIRKHFGRKEAVKSVNFSMGSGEVVSLLGPNGAGKTTLFYMIVGFIKPTAGQVYLNDVSIERLPMYQRARLGISYLPQEPSVFRKMTVEQNIRAVLEPRKDISALEKQVRIDNLLEQLSIIHLREQKAYTLSGGERRRTEIARALAIEPLFLLLDEPFAGIDPKARFEIKSIVSRLSDSGIGVLITDHNERETLEICDASHIINQGEIIVSGTKREIEKNKTARRIYLGEDYQS